MPQKKTKGAGTFAAPKPASKPSAAAGRIANLGGYAHLPKRKGK